MNNDTLITMLDTRVINFGDGHRVLEGIDMIVLAEAHNVPMLVVLSDEAITMLTLKLPELILVTAPKWALDIAFERAECETGNTGMIAIGSIAEYTKEVLENVSG